MEQPVLQLSSHEPPAHEPQPSEPARTLQLRLQTWKGAPRVAVLHPYNSDTFRVSETDSEQIEKVSLFYVGAGARVCAVLSRRPVPTRAEAANTQTHMRGVSSGCLAPPGESSAAAAYRSSHRVWQSRVSSHSPHTYGIRVWHSASFHWLDSAPCDECWKPNMTQSSSPLPSQCASPFAQSLGSPSPQF